MLADCGTKPVAGKVLRTQVSYLIGVRYCPHSSTQHYKLLDHSDCSYFKNLDKVLQSYRSFASPTGLQMLRGVGDQGSPRADSVPDSTHTDSVP